MAAETSYRRVGVETSWQRVDAETREAERGARTRDGREGDRERVGSGGEWVFSAPHLRCKMKGAGGVLSRGGSAAQRPLAALPRIFGGADRRSAAKGALDLSVSKSRYSHVQSTLKFDQFYRKKTLTSIASKRKGKL